MATLLQRVARIFTGRKEPVAPAPTPTAPPSADDKARAARDAFAKIDAAQTSDENKRHWAQADALGPNASYDPSIQWRLRNRSRYETLNNSYLKGLIRTKANDLIGTGPRPQIMLPDDPDRKLAKQIEAKYLGWAESVLLGQKLRLLQKQYERDGGGFLKFDIDPNPMDRVDFYPVVMEGDQCSTPFEFQSDPAVFDGVRFNSVGKPIAYYFLNQHPGEIIFPFALPQKWQRFDAANVVHWYPQDRAGQQRGIPETTPALPLFAQLRRWSLAALTNAEFAAMICGVLETPVPQGEQPANSDAWQFYEMVRGALMTTLPGQKATQLHPEQPTTTHTEFERSKLNEAGRSCGAPLNVTTGNSTDYNYSSGRLDHVPYHREAWIIRDDFRLIVLNPVFRTWATEALMLAGYLPEGLPPLEEWKISWQWDGFDDIDPVKTATANEIKLRTGATTLTDVYASDGCDFLADVVPILDSEIKALDAIGVTHPVLVQAAKGMPAADKGTATEELPPPKPTRQPPPPSRRGTPQPSRNGGYAHG